MNLLRSASSKVVALVGLVAATGIAQTPKKPLMGWSSWNLYYEDITEAKIKKQADAIVSSGLAAAGYDHINIDDGFFDGRNADGSLRINATRFPNGFKPVVDYIHSKGLKAGFYSDAGANMCAQMYGTETGGKGTGLYQHEEQDLNIAFKTWGFDYIKVDYCGGRQTGMDEQTRYTSIANAIKATGRTDIVYNICRWQFPGGWVATLGNSWRIADDIGPSWSHVTRILDTNRFLSGFSNPGHYNDMDMLEVGNGGWSDNEYKAHFALWSIHSSPMVLGNDMSNMKASVLSILTNKEVLALNQDTFGIQANRLNDDGAGGEVFAKRLGGWAGTERGVVVFNRSAATRTITVNFKDLDLEGSVTVRDLWAAKDLGSFEGSYPVSVPSHGAAALKISGGTSRLQETFEAEYAWMNNFKWTKSLQIQANQAKPTADAACSRGAKVGSLGKLAANYLEFNKVYAPQAGTYRVTVIYLSGEARSATVSVNGKDSLLNGMNSGSFTKRDSVTFPVVLKKGLNTIRFSNATAFMPDFDAIRVNVNSGIAATDPSTLQAFWSREVRLEPHGPSELRVSTDASILGVSVLDLSGKVRWLGDSRVIQTGSLQAGTYLAKIRTAQGEQVKTFTKL
ncbi:MAG: alpha-galactosidase [Fibrobacterota bacterium]|nr:MAG: alpha-galactosidase [Fibrobacterota bacterium]